MTRSNLAKTYMKFKTENCEHSRFFGLLLLFFWNYYYGIKFGLVLKDFVGDRLGAIIAPKREKQVVTVYNCSPFFHGLSLCPLFTEFTLQKNVAKYFKLRFCFGLIQ